MSRVSLSGGILAGGENRRMGGFPKGCLHLGESTFLERIVRVMEDSFGTVHLSVHGNPDFEVPDSVSTVPDRFQDRRASMNGVYSLLSHLRTPVLVVPWDMPQVNRSMLDVLRDSWEDPRRTVEGVFFSREDVFQPFPGIYGLDFLSELRRRLLEREYSLKKFLENRDTHVISHESHPDLPRLTNINTPEEYARMTSN